MKVTSKDGLNLEILPKNKWNPLDWFWCFEQIDIIKKQNIFLNNKEVLEFTHGSISRYKK